eukprot:3899918-Alexandrium_andersonii.AAC.1
MSASLVGSEMCIRDSSCPARACNWQSNNPNSSRALCPNIGTCGRGRRATCLLYTSDAADDM